MDDTTKKQGRFCYYLIAALSPLLLGAGVATGDNLVQLKEVAVDYKDFVSGGYDPLINSNGLLGREMGTELNLTLDTDVLSVFYFNNRIHGMTDELPGVGPGQFRTVGWQFQYGLRLSPALDIYYEHHSQHLLDTPGISHYPVNNSIGVKLILFTTGRREALIPW